MFNYKKIYKTRENVLFCKIIFNISKEAEAKLDFYYEVEKALKKENLGIKFKPMNESVFEEKYEVSLENKSKITLYSDGLIFN